jgi:hypothetical protein
MQERGRRRWTAVGRLALAILTGVLTVPWIGAAGGAEAEEAPPEIYEARAEAGAVTDSVSVPAQFEMFTPYSSSEAQNNSSHGLHAVFHPGPLLDAAAFQQGFSPPPGTTETFYPQGPFEDQAEVMPLPAGLGGAEGSAARSSGRSGPTGSAGEARYGGFAPSPGVSVQLGQARTSATAGSIVRSTAEVVLKQVHIGGLTVDSVTTLAEATADGRRGGAHTSSSVTLAGATLMGTPVTLAPTGLTVAGTTAEIPATSPIDQLLAEAGISIRRLPDRQMTSPDGTESRLDLGGLEVRLHQPGQNLSTGFVLGRVSVHARAVRLLAAPGIPPQIPSQPQFTPEFPTESEIFPGVASALLTEPLPPAAPAPTPTGEVAGGPAPGPAGADQAPVAAPPAPASPPEATRRQAVASPMAKREPVQRADWTMVSAAIALAAAGALILRRILRLAATP